MRGRRTHRGTRTATGGAPGLLSVSSCEGEVRALYVRAPRSSGHDPKFKVGYVCTGCGEVAIDHGAVPQLEAAA